jgi:predicted transcriptional regulator
MGKDKTEDDKSRVVGIYFEPAILRAIDKYAEAQRRSRSWMVNEIIREKCGVIEEAHDED